MSLRRSTIRAEQVKQLDRQTWSDLDAVGFGFEVSGDGEAIAGPFYFGRAFDAPPVFSFSASLLPGSDESAAPQITIGVSEWIIDEQDMYVGCWLWMAMTNCFDPGPSHGVVRDDNFEDLLAVQGGGPEGDEIPYVAFTWQEHPDIRPAQSYANLYWPSNYQWPSNNPGSYPVVSAREPGTLNAPYRWVQLWGGLENDFHDEPIQRWRTSNTVSRTGDFSLYCDELIEPTTKLQFDAGGGAFLVPANLLGCITYPDEDYREHLWGWRCSPGTEIKITGYRRHSDIALGSEKKLRISSAFYDEIGRLNGWTEDYWLDEIPSANAWHFFELDKDTATGSSEQQVGREGAPATLIAPEGTRYVRIEFDLVQFWLDRATGTQQVPLFETWLDDITIELIGSQTPLRQPEFDVAVKFQGRVLKNYVGVHPLRSYEGPSRVVLS